MSSAFLNFRNDVVAIATVPRTLVEVQNKLPEATEKIDNAPDGLKAFMPFDQHMTEFHRRNSGDGTDISHYITIVYSIAERQEHLVRIFWFSPFIRPTTV